MLSSARLKKSPQSLTAMGARFQDHRPFGVAPPWAFFFDQPWTLVVGTPGLSRPKGVHLVLLGLWFEFLTTVIGRRK